MKLSEIVSLIKKREMFMFRSKDEYFQIAGQLNKNSEVIYQIIIRITNKCNINCEYCFIKSTEYSKYDKKIESTINKLKDLDLDGSFVILSGGEPTIHPKYQEYVNKLRESNASLITQTNAILFSNNNFKNKIDLSNHRFFVSLPSAIKENYNKITNSNLFEKAIAGVYNLSLSNKTEINFVIYRENCYELPLLVDLIKTKFNYKNMLLRISNLGIVDKSNSKIQFERYSKIIPMYKNIFENENDFRIELTIGGGCGLPICVCNKITKIDQEYMFLADTNSISFNKLEKQYYKNSKCNNCSYDKYCQGFVKEYIEEFGDGEINPIH